MKVIVIGLNHKTAPLNIREKFSLITKEQEEILEGLKVRDEIKGGVVLSTCNRIEFYVTIDNRLIKDIDLTILNLISNLNLEGLRKYLYHYQGVEAVRHLYRVTSGLDSLLIGEVQILGQVKKAFAMAQELETLDSYSQQLFTTSFRVGKRARTQSKISSGTTSISYVAVELAQKIFGHLSGETVLILGAGKMSELTLKALLGYGVKGVMVANRTYANGHRLAQKIGGEAVKWDKLEEWLKKVDIIIASTAAPHYVLHYDLIKEVMKEKRGPLFLIDIAVPRDIEARIGEIDGVHLYDIDDLKKVVDQSIDQRQDEIDKVQAIIDKEVTEFIAWSNEQKVIPIIKKMRDEAKKIKDEELKRSLKKLNQGENKEVIEELAHRLTNKLLHLPTVELKRMARSKDEFISN